MYSLCLSAFTQHHYFETHSYCCYIIAYPSLLSSCIPNKDRPHFVYSFTCRWTFGLFPVFVYSKYDCHKTQVLYMDICFYFGGGEYLAVGCLSFKCMFNFLRNCQTVFHSGCTIHIPTQLFHSIDLPALGTGCLSFYYGNIYVYNT